jgi:putative methyltransferase (TIGR04325 family)
MNRLTFRIFKKIPWSLFSKTPRFGYKNTYVGIFPSWAAAMNVIPANKPVGYDQEAATDIFVNYPTAIVRSGDYAVILHLRTFVREGMRVVDVGGSIGQTYYIAQKFFDVPESLEWNVFDVPAVLEAGRKVAIREGEKSKGLRFVSTWPEVGPCELFISTGSLQLIEDTLPSMLQRLPRLPDHILINRIPVWDREAVVVINDMGFSFAPYNIFNKQQWVASVEQLGYKLVDDWPCPESTLTIQFHPRLRLNAYRGFYFKRQT